MDKKRSRQELSKEVDHLKEAEEGILKDTEKIKEVTDQLRAFLDQSSGATSNIEQELNVDIKDTQGKLIEKEQKHETKESKETMDKADERKQQGVEAIQNNKQTQQGLSKFERSFDKAGIDTKGIKEGQDHIEQENQILEQQNSQIENDKKAHDRDMKKTQDAINKERSREVKVKAGMDNFNSQGVVDNRASGPQRR